MATKTVRKSPTPVRRTATTPPESFTPTLTLPRLDATTNFVKFGIEVPRGTKGVPFGTIYVPLHAAEGVKRITVRFEK